LLSLFDAEKCAPGTLLVVALLKLNVVGWKERIITMLEIWRLVIV
jgi:hypothetical protein